MTNIFKSASKNLKDASEKHFTKVIAQFPRNQTNVLNENQFTDLTFDVMSMFYINRIHNKAFGKTAQTLTSFWCMGCSIENSPPNHDLWKAISQLTKVTSVTLNVNVAEIPENMIIPPNGTESQTQLLWFYNFHQNMTLKAGAFQNLNKIHSIYLWANLNKIEKSAFRLNQKSDKRLDIYFNSDGYFTADAFENGTFDGVQRPVSVSFGIFGGLDYLPEGSFKAFFDQNKQNKVLLYGGINCEECRNYWLIKDGRKERISHPNCSSNHTKLLFDDDVATKFKAKCTKLY